MISVAMLSKWHVHAADYARQAKEHPSLEICRVWDEQPDRGRAWAEELGVPFEPDLDRLLADPAVDAVIVDAPTAMHKQVMVAAARRGKHIFTEKVLALTTAECDEIFASVDEAGVQLMLSLPRLCAPYARFAEQALREGWLGRLTTIRCRFAHNGAVPFPASPNGWLPPHFFDAEACGGGALIDLGAHPIYLTNRLAGRPVAVTARLASYMGHAVDDNAVVVAEYPSGALGVIETSFVSDGSPFQLELYGTEGTLLVEEERVRIISRHLPQSGGDKWVDVADLPPALPTPMQQWAAMIERGEASAITRDDMRWLTEFNEAAARSSREGRRIELNG